jgi:cytochrome c peroxidase
MASLLPRIAAASALICVTLTLNPFVSYVASEDKANGKQYLVPIPLGLIETDIPKNNPLTEEKIRLGKKLFFDKRLSANKEISCATCHDPKHGFAEPRAVSISADGQLQRRNSPSILNAGYLTSTMWDGRFRTLEQQALDPFTRWGDMSIEVDEALDRIDADSDYRVMFTEAFGAKPSTTTLAQALASFQRSLVSGNTRFDQYLYGNREDALTEVEKTGFDVFVNQGSCIACHDVFHKSVNPLGGSIALFTDNRFHNLGVGYSNGRMSDTGRYEVTRDPDDWGAFKTPNLRNVALTAPYMHDGSIKTLEEVVEFYDRGCTPNPNLTAGIRPLYLTRVQKQALVAFLQSLTDPKFQKGIK